MDLHSKNVCLIGALHVFGYLLFSVEPLTRAIGKLNSIQNDETFSGSGPAFLFLISGVCLLFATFAGLMICGVLKQRHLLMLPFLIVSIMVWCLTTLQFLVYQFQEPIYFAPDYLFIIAIQIMVVYPIYTLFFQLRKQNLKEKALAVGVFDDVKKHGEA